MRKRFWIEETPRSRNSVYLVDGSVAISEACFGPAEQPYKHYNIFAYVQYLMVRLPLRTLGLLCVTVLVASPRLSYGTTFSDTT